MHYIKCNIVHQWKQGGATWQMIHTLYQMNTDLCSSSTCNDHLNQLNYLQIRFLFILNVFQGFQFHRK